MMPTKCTFAASPRSLRTGPTPSRIIKLKELYEILENATDICESVGNIIESIVLKHN